MKKYVPKSRKIVGSKWVHTFKGDELSNCVKTKSRLVAKGFSQIANIDYHETTSPTPASAPVKMIAVIANEKGLPVFHLDVSQAFVQVPLQENIFMRLPQGCSDLSRECCEISQVPIWPQASRQGGSGICCL